jgi:hypothetical protein
MFSFSLELPFLKLILHIFEQPEFPAAPFSILYPITTFCPFIHQNFM